MIISTVLILIILLSIFLLLNFIQNYINTKNSDPDKSLVEKLNKCLPQTQCGQCGYAGCLPYAQAIAQNNAEINKCPPGGDETLQNLAQLLGKDLNNVDLTHIKENADPMPIVAKIREIDCIGCTKCISACPVDAIIGAAKQMHVVLTDHCTGCKLCLPPCPMDCIDLIEQKENPKNWQYKPPIVLS